MTPGITSTQALLTLILAVYHAGKDLFPSGKFDATKLGELLTIVPAISPAINGMSTIPAELKDLDATEGAALVTQVALALSIVDTSKTEIVINKSLLVAIAIKDLVSAIEA